LSGRLPLEPVDPVRASLHHRSREVVLRFEVGLASVFRSFRVVSVAVRWPPRSLLGVAPFPVAPPRSFRDAPRSRSVAGPRVGTSTAWPPLQSSLTGLGSRTLLSWARSSVIPTDIGLGVHSRSHLRSSFGRTVPPVRSRSVFAVLHCLGGLLHLGFAGLLHPAAGRMFAAFHGSSALGSLPGASFRSSRRCSHPPKFSSSTAAPRHRGPCLLAVRLRLPGYVRPFERPRFRGRSWFDTCADRAGRSPPSEWLVWVTSACAAASQVRLPRGSASWSADVRGCPQTSDSDSDSRLPTPPISRDGSADPLRAPPGLPRRDTASTRENRRVAPLAVRCRRALLGRHARARSAPTSAGGVVARIASHRLPDRRWRSLVPGSLRRSGVGAPVPSSRS
jgi:hypothetical protein